MAVTEQDLKTYLRLPPDSTEDLAPYLSAARSKARAAGIPDFSHNAQYDLFLKSLAAFYYDNRGFTFGGSYQATAEENARRMINAFVLELRYAGEDPEPDASPEPDPEPEPEEQTQQEGGEGA